MQATGVSGNRSNLKFGIHGDISGIAGQGQLAQQNRRLE